MAFTGLTVTDFGLRVAAKTIADETIKITRVAIGDGLLGSGSIPSLTHLISERMSIEAGRVLLVDNQATVSVNISNRELDEGFYFNEMGLYCLDPESGEEGLFSADISQVQGELIGDKNSKVRVNFTLRLRTAFSSTDKIDFQESEHPDYVTPEELDTHNQSGTAHSDIRMAIGEKIAQTEKGAANGVAPLGSNAKIASTYLPALDFIPTSEKGQPNGVAALGANGKVVPAQVDAYPKLENIAAATKSTLGIATTATPDDALQALIPRFGTCTTAAATTAKAATVAGFRLFTGATVSIRFSVANTAASPTLNVNGTGAKPMFSAKTNTAISRNDYIANETTDWVYNGAQWVLLSGKPNGKRLIATFTASGTFRPADYGLAGKEVDVYMVGGGGAGAWGNSIGNGGASGYAIALYSVAMAQSAYQIIVGAGGSAPTSSGTGNPGGATEAFGRSIDGGKGGVNGLGNTAATGGSGGAAYDVDGVGRGGTPVNNADQQAGGAGGGATLYVPVNPFDGLPYGGSGGGGFNPGSRQTLGGEGGGGNGGNNQIPPKAGTPGTGSGGGGGMNAAGGSGGSGVVMIYA